jgi:hypothetical protein
MGGKRRAISDLWIPLAINKAQIAASDDFDFVGIGRLRSGINPAADTTARPPSARPQKMIISWPINKWGLGLSGPRDTGVLIK